MNRVFIARGTRYADDKTFDGFDVIAEPCADRESRIFGADADGRGGTDYRSHSYKLATRGAHSYKGNRSLFLLVEHGGGREVLAVPSFYDGGAWVSALLAMPERLQYGTLATLYQIARHAHDTATDTTREEWAQAFVDGRIRKSRAKQGRRTVFIEPRTAAPARPADDAPSPDMASAARQLGFVVFPSDWTDPATGAPRRTWIACEPAGIGSRGPDDYASETDAWKACAVKVTGAPWPDPDALDGGES
jgi:hypothetical protein